MIQLSAIINYLVAFALEGIRGELGSGNQSLVCLAANLFKTLGHRIFDCGMFAKASTSRSIEDLKVSDGGLRYGGKNAGISGASNSRLNLRH